MEDFIIYDGVLEKYNGCDEYVVIPNGVEEIGIEAFANCESLKGVEISSSVIDIERYAFFNCTGLEEVIIPKNVEYISAFSFKGCTNLKRVEILGKTSELYCEPFNGCDDVVIYFHDRELDEIPEDYRTEALLGIICIADKYAVSENILKSCEEYVMKSAKELYPRLVKFPELYEYMCEKKAIPPKDSQEVMTYIGDNIELKASFMQYLNDAFGQGSQEEIIENVVNDEFDIFSDIED